MKKVYVINFGSQYVQLIARRVRELDFYSEIVPPSVKAKDLKEVGALILSGGPASVYERGAPLIDREILSLNLPVLGICYGLQVITHLMGGKVLPSKKQEYGRTNLKLLKEDPLFEGIPKEFEVWMSHSDRVEELPVGFEVLGSSENSPYAIIKKGKIYGLQFHPEVSHTQYGKEILKNFLKRVANLKENWSMEDFIRRKVEEIKEEVGSSKVISAVSGGVDSTVASLLVSKAVGENLICVFINHGLLRKGEEEEVLKNLRSIGLNPILRREERRFLERLRGITDPEEKRKIIGKTFIEVLEEVAKEFKAKYLLQGTLYPDVVESAGILGSAKIKTHHNVGGLPERMNLKLLEPLRELFKDEVRELGKKLGISEEILNRHPFPGPGLAIRIIGEVDEESLKILREADYIFLEELKRSGLYKKVWQAFAVLLPIKSVGVMGDGRTYERVVALRAVESKDGMTADWARLPHSFLDKVMRRIINEVKGVNRVVYDISSKPPSTIEWE